jgi:hypothetical protein
VLAIGSKVRGFKPGRGDRSSRAIKIRSTPAFRAEIKPLDPRRKILWRIKGLYEYERDIS